MPKRAKTPPIDDGAKYLTVVGPYPAHPNMELDQHRREFSRWLASCTGSAYLRAFYHKPTSPGSVIVEVDESFPDFKRVLGEHKWREFLVEPKDEGHFVSKVFYCTYNTDRDVQKHGWKRVDIEEKWFKTKAPSKFVSPYPGTYYCEVPPEKNPIHNPLSRPLPRSDFPPPPSEPSPVVGTVEWQEWKQRQKAPRVVTSWTRGAPQGQAPALPSTTSSAPVSRAASSRGSSQPHTVPRQAWKRAIASLSPPGLPPGITRGGSSSGSSQRSADGAWGEPSSRRSTSPVGKSSSSGTASGDDIPPATPASDAPKDVKVAEQIVDPFVALSMDDYEDDVYYSVGGGSAAGDFADEDDMYFPRANAVFATESKDSDAQNGGGGEEDEDEDEDENVAQNPLLCPEHNIVCKKGICKVYAARKREEERNKRREEREKEREQARAKREKNVKKGKNSVFKSEPSSEPNGTSTPGSSSARSPPPHLRVGAAVPTPRAPPPHLKAGAPPPPPSSSTRPLPPHLQRGASAPSGPASPSPPGHQDGRVTPTQEHAGQDDARSESSGWGNPSEGPWGPTTNPGWNRTLSAPARAPAPASVPAPRPALPTPTHQAWGAWGKAPSISASSVRRNNDSWSVSAHSTRDGKNGANAKGIQQPQKPQQQQQQQQQWGAWGRAPSISASSVRRNNDSWSVSALSAAAKGDADNDDDARSVAASDTSGWGRPPSVVGARRTWADQMDDEDDKAVHARAAEDDDVRSVAASTESGWGNPSVGPW